MALKSEQARVLKRHLLTRLIRNLVLFTGAFALICALLELTVMGSVADFVADQTSSWRTLDSSEQYDEIMARRGLEDTELTTLIANDLIEWGFSAVPGSAQSALTQDEASGTGLFDDQSLLLDQFRTVDDTMDDDSVDEIVQKTDAVENENSSIAVSTAGDKAAYDARRQERFNEVLGSLGDRQSQASAVEVATEALLQQGVETSGLSLGVPEAIQNARVSEIVKNAAFQEMSQEELSALSEEAFHTSQTQAYEQWLSLPAAQQAEALGLSSSVSNPHWRTVLNPDGYWRMRDLSTYYTIRSLKLPLLVLLLVIGWVVIVAQALNQSLRYFDELSGAVGKLLAHRSAPIKLPPDLAIAQNELAVIRSEALADERAARAAEQRKNELVAYLAHDIRTPLTSVLGYLDLLASPQELLPATQRAYAQTALGKAERLEGLVDEFFEITRYNLQAIPIERSNVDVRLFCQQVAEAFYPEIQARSIQLRISAPEGVQFFVDPDKLARALGNVLRNGVAYAEEHSTIDIQAKPTANQVQITVRNRGQEISPTHLASIFEKFYRADGSRSSSKGGAGLGLAIAREIVEAHHGTIGATSEGGVTIFTITVPRRPPRVQTMAPQTEEHSRDSLEEAAPNQGRHGRRSLQSGSAKRRS